MVGREKAKGRKGKNKARTEIKERINLFSLTFGSSFVIICFSTFTFHYFFYHKNVHPSILEVQEATTFFFFFFGSTKNSEERDLYSFIVSTIK